MNKLAKPSSTITAASLAGIGMAVLWGTLNEFTSLTVSAGYIALSTQFVSSLVGYFKKEKVLKPENLG